LATGDHRQAQFNLHSTTETALRQSTLGNNAPDIIAHKCKKKNKSNSQQQQ